MTQILEAAAKTERNNKLDQRDWANAVRSYPKGTLVFNYKKEVVEIYNPDTDTPALIFGSLGKRLCLVAGGIEKCSMQFMKDKVKNLNLNFN